VERIERTESGRDEFASTDLDRGVERHVDRRAVDPESSREPTILAGVRVGLDQMGGRADESDFAGLRVGDDGATAVVSSRTRGCRWSSNGHFREHMSR
jgi:hypothetical protein